VRRLEGAARYLVNPVLALALCAAAGALFAWLRTPLPWMIGPLLAMAVFNFSGRGCAGAGGRQLGQLIIGTRSALFHAPGGAPGGVLLALARFRCAVFDSGRLGLRLVPVAHHGHRPHHRLFRQRSRGAAEMAILGERFGARVDRIALAQSLRVLVVVIVVPYALTYSGVHGSDGYQPAAVPLDWPKLAILFGIAAACGGVLTRAGMRMPSCSGRCSARSRLP